MEQIQLRARPLIFSVCLNKALGPTRLEGKNGQDLGGQTVVSHAVIFKVRLSFIYGSMQSTTKYLNTSNLKASVVPSV